MGVRIKTGKNGSKAISGLSIKDLNELVERGGLSKVKALNELTKRAKLA